MCNHHRLCSCHSTPDVFSCQDFTYHSTPDVFSCQDCKISYARMVNIGKCRMCVKVFLELEFGKYGYKVVLGSHQVIAKIQNYFASLIQDTRYHYEAR